MSIGYVLFKIGHLFYLFSNVLLKFFHDNNVFCFVLRSDSSHLKILQSHRFTEVFKMLAVVESRFFFSLMDAK